MKFVFKFLALLFIGYFIWASYVQHNDPDATIWYAIYGVAIVASMFFIADKLKFIVAAILMVGYLIGTAIFWPETYEGITIGGGENENIERGREALGLLIVAAVMCIYTLRIKFSKASANI